MPIDNVADIKPLVQYTAAGGQTVFTYPFPITAEADIVVYVNASLQALGTNYTVEGEGNDNGGTITFLVGRTAGEIITLYRDIPIARTSDFQQNGPWFSTDTNSEFIRIIMMLQQLETSVGRSLRWPLIDDATDAQLTLDPIANWLNKYIFVNGNGLPEPAAIVPTTISQSIIGALLFPQTSSESAAGVLPTNFAYQPGDIRRYGALEAGFDCTTAITNAINTDHEVFIPNGTWRITSALPFVENLCIRGAGVNAVLLVDGTNISAFANTTGGSVIYMNIGNFTIRANQTSTASALSLTDISRSVFYDIVVDRAGAGDGFAYGIRLQGSASACFWNRFYNIEVTAVISGGFRLDAGAADNFFYSCRMINHISAYLIPVGLWITSGVNNRFYGMTLEAIYSDGANDVYAIRLDEDADSNSIIGVRTEGHSGTVANAFGVFFNGGDGNQIIGHYLLGTSGNAGTLGTNTWTDITTISGQAGNFLGGSQTRVPINTANPTVDNGAINYNTTTNKLMAFVNGSAKEICPATEGTFTGTLTGFTVNPTGTVRWVRNGNTVVVQLFAGNGTSNATTMTLTGAPADIFPARSNRHGGILMRDNGTINTGTVNVGTDGVMTFGFGPTEAAFTASGTKELFANTFVYSLT